MVPGILALALVCGSTPQPQYSWDFESLPQGLNLTQTELVSSQETVVDSRQSLLADSRTSDEDWNEFLHSDPTQVPLKPNTAYTISLTFRAVEPVGRKVFYLLMRSQTAGAEAGDKWGGMWEAWDNKPHTKNFVIRTGSAPDYFVIIGILGHGAMVLDNLSIREGNAAPEGTVAARPFHFRKEWASRLGSKQTDMIRNWIDKAQVVVDPGGWNYRLDKNVPQLVDLNPDIGAYLSDSNPLVKELGFVRTSASMEYQELYVMDAEKIGKPWEQMLDEFMNDGMAIDLDGEPEIDQTWAAGGYFTCQSNDKWHQYYLDDMKPLLGEWNGLNQDNIGVVGVFKGNAAYCPGCQGRFRAYMKLKYSEESLREWGIEDVDSFDFLRFVLDHSLEGRESLRSPVVREYIKCYQISQLSAWIDTTEHIREWTAGLDRPYPVYGNQIGAMGPLPYPVMLCPWVDAVSMEHYWPTSTFYKEPRFHNAAWGYKLAASASGYKKPVYVMNALEAEGKAELSRTCCEITLAEGLANGGIRVFSPGANIPQYKGPQPLEVPAIRDLHKGYADFIRANRGLFWERKPVHRAAVVYSVPTHMFHRFPAISGMDDPGDYYRFAAACLMLEKQGIPYDVLVLPHPELMPGEDWKQRIGEYDLLVMPGVQAISREQWDLISKNKVPTLAFMPFAEYDENYNKLDLTLPDEPWLRLMDDYDLQLGTDLWHRRTNDKAQREIERVLGEFYPVDKRQVRSDLPGDTSVNIWEDEQGRFAAIHLLNYSWNVAEDRPLWPESMQLSVVLPEKYQSFAPVLITPDSDAPVTLKQHSKDGLITVEVPRINVYGVIVWGDLDYIRVKTDYAQACNLGMRLVNLGKPIPKNWANELQGMWGRQEFEKISNLRAEWQSVVDDVEAGVLDKLP